MKEYIKDSESLFINHLYNVDEEQGEDLTSFFVRKSIYSTFFVSGNVYQLTLLNALTPPKLRRWR